MTQRQEKALQALLVCRTQKEAAAMAGIRDSTLRNYLHDPEFAAEFRRASAALVDDATQQLKQALPLAVQRLISIIQNDNETSKSHIAAARAILEYGLRFTEFNDILRELEDEDTT